MTIVDNIRDEKLQKDVNRVAAKISTLSSGKMDKYEYLTGEEILPSNQSRIIELAKFAYSPQGKALEKQTNKQGDALKSLKLFNRVDELNQIKSIFLENQLNDLIIDKLK